MFAMPWLDGSRIRSMRFRPLSKIFFWIFVINGLFLGYLGSISPDEILWFGFEAIVYAQISTLYYFAYFCVIIPVVSRMETTLPVPTSIAASVLEANRKG
jgi:quinol-cytochrome oxidoreductase complex cytochrome b subunit